MTTIAFLAVMLALMLAVVVGADADLASPRTRRDAALLLKSLA